MNPLYRTDWSREKYRTHGATVAKLGADMGLIPDPEQQEILDALFAETDDGLPLYDDAAAVAPRQNIKTATFEVAALADVYVFGVELHVWTAHQFKTARKTFEDMRRRIQRHPDYAGMTTFRDSHGEEAIILDTGERIEFHARSGGSGRGFTAKRITLDEALYLQPGDLGALVPTIFTMPDAQVRYASSAGKRQSATLRAIRDRGRLGDGSLFYVEYGAPHKACQKDEEGGACSHALGTEGCALDDEDLWLRANCAIWAGRASLESVAKQRQMLPADEFSREFLTWWEDPPEDEFGVFDGTWPSLADPDAERGSNPVFGLAVAPDRSWSAVAVAYKRPDHLTQVMLADYRPGTAWIDARVTELRDRWHGRVIASTTAKGLVADAEEPAQGLQALAHTSLDDAVKAQTVRHGNEPALNTAVRGARWKPYGDTRMFDRKGSTDISPLDAAALAVWGLADNSNTGGWVVAL